MATTFTGMTNDEILASLGVTRKPSTPIVSAQSGAATTAPAAVSKEDEEKENLWERIKNLANNGKEAQTNAYTNTADYYKKQAEENPDTRTWLQKGTLEDGYQFGDLTKGSAASAYDVLENVGAGVLGLGEKFADAATQLGAWSYGGLKQTNPGAAQPSYSFSLEDREKEQEKAKEFIAKDLYDEKALSKNIFGNKAQMLGIDTDKESFLGEKTDALAQSGGQLLGTAAAQFAGVPWFATTGLSSFGGSLEEAYNEGASFKEAGISAAISAAAEMLSEKLSGGIKFNGATLDDKLSKAISKKIANKAARILLQTSKDAAGEGLEELLSGYVSAIGKKLTYADEKTINEIFSNEEKLESFIGGAILGGGIGLAKNVQSGGVVEGAEPIAKQPQISPSKPAENQQANVTPQMADPNQGASGEANSAVEIERDNDGNVTVVIGADILNGKPRSEWKAAIHNELKRLFANGIKLPRGTVFINKKGRGEFTNGSYTKMLERTAPDVYEDKMRMASGADALLINAENVTPENNEHERNDDIVSFNRGNIRVRVKGTDYTGDILTAIYSDGKETFFDINNLVKNENEAAPERYANDNAVGFSQTGATSEVNVPQSISNVNNVSNAESGIYDVSTGAAKIKQGEMVDTQSKATTKNINLGEESREAVAPAQHEQISEKLSLARAGANIMVDGNGNIVDFEGTVDDLLNKEKWSGVDEDTAQLLLAEAEKRNDAQTIKRLAERIQITNTEAAQLLQSTQKWIEKNPGGRLAAMYQLVAKYAKDHKAKKGKVLEIPDELAKKYLAAQTEVERDAVIGEIQQHIADSTKSTFLDWWTALRYTNMLGNFKTQIRNISGNLVNKITYGIKDDIAAIIEAISKSDRTKSVAVGREWMKAAKADYKNAEKQIFALGKYTNENFKGEFIEGIEKNRTILPPGLEQYRKATNWAMEQGDAIFAKSAYTRSLAGFLKANGVKAEQLEGGTVSPELMERAREYAVKQAREQTFRDSNAFSDWVSRIGRREDTPKLAKVISEGVAPFRRTPANIMVRAAEFSPAGLVKGAYDAATKSKRDIDASTIIDELAKGLTGTALLAVGAILGKAGLLRGSGNEEEEDIDALMNRQDWSIVIPGVGSYTIDWAAPTTLPLFVGAQLIAALDGEGLTMREIEQVFYSITEPIVAMSMLNGIEDTLNNAKYSDNNFAQLLASSALSYVTQGLTNTLLGQVERVFETERMSTYADKMKDLPDWLQRGIGKASAKIPGFEFNQTEYLNEFGETESSGSLAGRIFENLFSPGYFEASKEGEKAYDFVQDMYDRFGISAAPNAYAENSIEVKGKDYQLTQEQKNQYQEVRGQTIKEFYEALDSNKAFSRLGGEDAGAVISTLMSYANKKAKYEVATDMGLDMERTAKEQVYDDMTPSQYIEYLVLGERTPVAATYADKPQWQQYEQAINTLPDSLAIDMIYAGSEVNGKKFEAAVNAGVSLEDALAYYKALTQRTIMGKEPTADEKAARIAELGFSENTLNALIAAWDSKK